MPPRSLIGKSPHSYAPRVTHQEPAAPFAAVFNAPGLKPLSPAGHEPAALRLLNAGTQAWAATGSSAISLTYHLFTAGSDPWAPFSPFSVGVVALGQGRVPLPHTVLPGHAVSLHAIVTAPPQPGHYLVVWDLEEEPSIWLSQAGLLPRARPLLVEGHANSNPVSTPTPSPAPTAAENSMYVADTSLPDGTHVDPAVAFQKSWLVFNSGARPWGPDWTLQHVSGQTFGLKSAPLPVVAACTTTNLQETLVAPRKPGSYVGVWQMRDPAGQAFGDKLTVRVTVRGPRPTGTPVVPDTPTPTPVPKHPTATPTATAAG
jgi:hypothetical protein